MTENNVVEVVAPEVVAPVAKEKKSKSKKQQKLIADIITYIVLIVGAFVMLYPFWWMIAASFCGNTLSIQSELTFWPSAGKGTWDVFGSDFEGIFALYTKFLDNDASGYVYTLCQGKGIFAIIGNTLVYSIVPVVVGVVTSASAAFAFAKIEWIGRDVVFLVLLSAIMIPGPSIMVIQYCMYSAFNWLGKDTGWMVMVIPGLFGSIMTAFFIRQFLYGMPTSIIEAAKIDGAGYWRIFWSFIMPLAMPAVVAQGLLSFMGCWNNYMGCWVMLSGQPGWWNLPVLLAQLSNTVSGTIQYYGCLFAGSVISILPVLILFGIFQKQIIGSLMLTGSKE